MGYKSRGNYAQGLNISDDKWESIFGTTKPKGTSIGIVPKDKAQRRDYELCRKLDYVLEDYKRFIDVKDREKIKDEYFGRQKEQREKAVRELDRYYPDRFNNRDFRY